MDSNYLQKLSYTDLKKLAEDMEIEVSRKKDDLINNILICFRKYEEYKKEKIDKYTRIQQIGNKGKEGVTYLVKTEDNKTYAMKTFKKTKSSARLRLEAQLQEKASVFDICPKIIDIDTVSKFIVMEKLDKHLFEVIKEQKGILTVDQQKQLIHIYKCLDEAKVFHADSNILNYMFKKINYI
jgi:tRNA A-37 threonylcarbamoyl transferase component Bud32